LVFSPFSHVLSNTGQQAQANQQDQTKTGYILGPAHNQVGNPMGVREIGSLEVAIIRFFLHSTMYIQCCDGKEIAIKKLIICQPKNSKEFLENHLKDGLTQIGRMLGKNEEYAQLLLMKVS
jgi:hypothetical protein